MSVEQQDEKGRRKKEESIFEFASMVKELDSQIKELTEKKKVLKEEIRGLLKELEVRHAEARLERTLGLHALGGATEEMLAADELNLEIVKQQLLQVTKSMENQKASLEAEIEGLELQVQIKANEIREAERDLEQAGVRADRTGVVTWVREDVGATVNAGDAVARVADLSSYKIEAQISDIHASRLRGYVSSRLGNLTYAGSWVSPRMMLYLLLAVFMIL